MRIPATQKREECESGWKLPYLLQGWQQVLHCTEQYQKAYIVGHGPYALIVNSEKKQYMRFHALKKGKSCFRRKTALKISFSAVLGDMGPYRLDRERRLRRFSCHQPVMVLVWKQVFGNFDCPCVFYTSSVMEYLVVKYVLHSFSVFFDRYLISGRKVPAKN